jgi:antitoxin component YwqK of YwqJK toxin-antitoxin module
MKYSEYGNYKDGVKNGKWTEYYENGTLINN